MPWWRPTRLPLVWLSLVGDLTGSLVTGNVYRYEDQVLEPNVIQYRRVGMWTARDAPMRGSPGKPGVSSVAIDLQLSRTRAERPGLVQVLVFHSAYLSAVGTAGASGTSGAGGAASTYCCTPELHARGAAGCEHVGGIVVDPSRLGTGVFRHDLRFAANQSVAAVRTKVAVARSGVHYLLLASCDLQTERVLISGQTTWLNPYGYLPGELYPFLPFFGGLSLAYVALGVLWLVLCLRHCAQLLPLQSCISAVIFLGAVESATWYFDYISFNAGGTRGVAPVVLGVLLSTVKKCVSRLLVLVVCLGYGVVRPTLGNVAYRVMALGLVYFVLAATLDVASNVSKLSQLSVSSRLLLIIPMALLDAFFYWWLFSGLARTLQQLSSRRQSAKLLLYRRFSHVLLAAVVASTLWVGSQMAVIVSASLDARWNQLWVFDAFWHVLYFMVLLAICYLWSPSKNNRQYAYMDELGQEADTHPEDEELN